MPAKHFEWAQGINAIPDHAFRLYAEQFVAWCKSLQRDVVYIVSHDGTITSYRQFFGESVTRQHFLGDATWWQLQIE